MAHRLAHLLIIALTFVSSLGCERALRSGGRDGSPNDTEDTATERDSREDSPETGLDTLPETAPDAADTGDLTPDTTHDTAHDSSTDAEPDTQFDTTDTLGDLADTTPPCPPGSPCTLFGFVPPCFEGRCSVVETCVPTRITGCCSGDNDCLPSPDLMACETTRCINRVCAVAREPGCCAGDFSCDDGLATTTDLCLPSARCGHCPEPCARPPVLERRFDTAESLQVLGFIVLDPQPNDQVTWLRDGTRSAAGAGAAYLGNPRCRTYYGGGLDASCQPVSTEQQDSQRVSPTLLSPYFNVPPDTPAIASMLVFADVEPAVGKGESEPDVLRVLVESPGAPTWTVASTLELGKSTDWTPWVVDLAPWRGQLIRLRFEFDTLDGLNNLFEGVWLDELVIAASCSTGGCCSQDTDCPQSDGCNTPRCLPTANSAGHVCVAAPEDPGGLCSTCLIDLQCDDADPCTTDRCIGAGERPGRCEHDAFCCLSNTLLVADFADSLAPLTTDSTTTIRWHAYDGVARFGDPFTGTFMAGDSRTSASLSTPPITLPSRLSERQRLLLDFLLELSTEWDLAPPGTFANPAALDRLVVEIIDGALVAVLWDSDLIEGTTRGEMLPISLDLEPWRGRTILVRFTFDSGDGAANDFGGPHLDDLVVSVGCR